MPRPGGDDPPAGTLTPTEAACPEIVPPTTCPASGNRAPISSSTTRTIAATATKKNGVLSLSMTALLRLRRGGQGDGAGRAAAGAGDGDGAAVAVDGHGHVVA